MTERAFHWLVLMLVLVLILAGGIVALFAQELTDLSFRDLARMSIPEQEAFMKGFILGVFSAAIMANKKYGLDEDQALDLMILDLHYDDLLDQTYRWYEQTKSLKTPLTFAVYGRNYR